MKRRGIWWLQERPSSRIHASSATFNLYTHLQTGPNFVGVLCPNFLEPVGNYSSLSRAGKHARFSSFLTTKKIIISIPPHNLRLVNQSFCGQNKTRTSTRALTVLESFRSEIDNEEEYEFVCLVTVRMCSCPQHVTRTGNSLSAARGQRHFEEKSSPRERDLQRWVLHFQLIKNHADVFFKCVIHIELHGCRNTDFFLENTWKTRIIRAKLAFFKLK